MDPHSEVEAKFDAEGLLPSQIQEYVDFLTDTQVLSPFQSYREVTGTDSFWKVSDNPAIRCRHDTLVAENSYGYNPAPVDSVCLTIKQRKHENSLLDRHEVDLPVAEGVPVETAEAFLRLSGATHEFTIKKHYWVWLVNYGKIDVCLALYDVSNLDGSNPQRFLEVEIEKHSGCSLERGRMELDRWVEQLRHRFHLEHPVNKSLYEMYKPKP